MLEPFDIIIRIFNSSVRTHVLTPDDYTESIFARGLSKWHLNSKSIAPSKAMIPVPFFLRLNNIFFNHIRRSWRRSVSELRSTVICIILCSFQVVIYTVRIFYFGKFGINKNARSFSVCSCENPEALQAIFRRALNKRQQFNHVGAYLKLFRLALRCSSIWSQSIVGLFAKFPKLPN